MRTTLDIENDVLAAVKELARQQNIATGKLVSQLVRDALSGSGAAGKSAPGGVAGFRPFPARGAIVTNAAVDQLRDEDGV